jgi:hypothetical protein
MHEIPRCIADELEGIKEDFLSLCEAMAAIRSTMTNATLLSTILSARTVQP